MPMNVTVIFGILNGMMRLLPHRTDIMKDIVDVDEGDFERLINCICLKFIRKVQLEKDIRLTAAEIKSLIQKKEEKSYGG